MRKGLTYVLVAVMLCASLAGALSGLAQSQYLYSTTPLGNASDAKLNNIELAAFAIDGLELMEGDEFSFNDIVGARSSERGYRTAPNGRGVKVVGGGVAQVATTMYLALMQMDDIEYNSLHTYGSKFTDDYVDSGYMAIATDYDDDLDFRFTSYYPGVITIRMWVDEYSVSCLIELDDQQGDGLMGYAATPVYGSDGKIANIELAALSIFGTTLYHGDMFSFNEIVGARTAERGYQRGVNGRGSTVVGGGVAQVASTVYLAVKDIEDVVITEKRTYGDKFSEWYVNDADDAILTDYNSDIDFAFRYLGYDELVIYTYLSDAELICEVFEGG